MANFLAILESAQIKHGSNGLDDVKYDVQQGIKSIQDNQYNCARRLADIFSFLKMPKRAENGPIGFRGQVAKVKQGL